jgi:hypothetical protein
MAIGKNRAHLLRSKERIEKLALFRGTQNRLPPGGPMIRCNCRPPTSAATLSEKNDNRIRASKLPHPNHFHYRLLDNFFLLLDSRAMPPKLRIRVCTLARLVF